MSKTKVKKMTVMSTAYYKNIYDLAQELNLSPATIRQRAKMCGITPTSINGVSLYADDGDGNLSPVSVRTNADYFTPDQVKKISDYKGAPGGPRTVTAKQVNGSGVKDFRSINDACLFFDVTYMKLMRHKKTGEPLSVGRRKYIVE